MRERAPSILLAVFVVTALFIGVFGFEDVSKDSTPVSSSDQTDNGIVAVQQYTVTDIDGENNTITISADLREVIQEESYSVSPNLPINTTDVTVYADGEVLVETDNRDFETNVPEGTDNLTYEFTFTNIHQNRQFISEHVVYLQTYGFQFTEKGYTEGEPNVTLSPNSNYSSVYTENEDLVVYRNDTQESTVRTQSGHETQIIAPSSYNISDEIDGVRTIMQFFEDPEQIEKSNLYILPPENIRGGGYAMNYQSDNQNLWVSRYSEYSRLQTSMHEVVHANQGFDTSADMEWFTEGSAEYIATLGVSNQIDANITFLEFNEDWYGRDAEHTDDVTLSEPSSWDSNVEYNRGEHVVYLIDISLRHHTDGNTTSIDLVQWMNSQDGEITYKEFRSYVVDHTDEQFGQRLDEYMTTTDIIDISEEREEITGRDDYVVLN